MENGGRGQANRARKGIDAESMTSSAHVRLITHNLAFFIVTILGDKGSPVLGDIPTG